MEEIEKFKQLYLILCNASSETKSTKSCSIADKKILFVFFLWKRLLSISEDCRSGQELSLQFNFKLSNTENLINLSWSSRWVPFGNQLNIEASSSITFAFNPATFLHSIFISLLIGIIYKWTELTYKRSITVLFDFEQ